MNKQVEKLPMLSQRYEALGDGIFAVAATILILDIHLPEGGGFESNAAFFHFLKEVMPNVVCYFTSFTVLGIMWFGHRAMFEYIERTNRYFIFLGFIFYALICFVPFSTKLLAFDPLSWYGILIYGINLSLCNLSLYVQWYYGINRPGLMGRKMNDDIRKQARFLFLLSPVVYTVAIALAFWFPAISLVIFVVTPILYLLPNQLDKYLH
ncbi:MAG: TMEM175 family protein [Flavobacteriales bacterium]